MKFIVKIEDRQFEVEIQDIYARPIIASVDGDPIEIWLEDVPPAGQMPDKKGVELLSKPKVNGHRPASSSYLPAKNGTEPQQAGAERIVRAPIPGTIVSITVKDGAEVTTGQELLILEAMKMRNSIRSPRAGRIQSVHVIPGQTVHHHDVLLEFVE